MSNINVIEFENKKYPKKLRKIKNPPQRLYVQGDIELLNKKGIAIVGSRNCTQYGIKWCEKLTKDLLEYNLVIISGMARGIDSVAHNITIRNGMKTIAVLPSGFNNIYPKSNIQLYKNILKSGGTIVTEYEENVVASSSKFLARNRIVSGLAIGTLVVEAGYRSGTSVTASLTKEQGKKVFCVPGNLENFKSIGTNTLIKKGAKLVTSAEDIAKNYHLLKCESNKKKIEIPSEYEDIYNLITEKPIDTLTIIKKSNLRVSEVMSKLTILELEEKIKKVAGDKFVRL